MSTIKHGPLYLTKLLRDRMDAAGMPRQAIVSVDMAHGDDRTVECAFFDGEIIGMRQVMHGETPRSYDNPAWPDLTERFTPTMAGLPEPEPDFTAWRNLWFWSVLLTFYGLVILLICLLVTGG